MYTLKFVHFLCFVYVIVPPQLSIAPVLAGVFPLARILLLGVRVLMDTVVVSGLHLLEVLPPEVDMVIPAAIPREIQMLM